MEKKKGSVHRVFLVASFIWVFSYLGIYLAICNPAQLSYFDDNSSIFIIIFLLAAFVSMITALVWGLKELQREPDRSDKHQQVEPFQSEKINPKNPA